MQKVTVKVENERGEIHGTFLVEEKRTEGWSRVSVKDIGVPSDATQSLVLRDNQRLIFEPGVQDDQMVYDREQGASINPRTQKQADVGEVRRADRPNPNDKIIKETPRDLLNQQQKVQEDIRQPDQNKPVVKPLPSDQSPKPGLANPAGATQGGSGTPHPAPKPSTTPPASTQTQPPANTNPASAPGGAKSSADVKNP